ncbi:MAG: transporter substrate-binding domain-containing protein [Pseudomonadales bacterium]|nr:transporter substrate-binding domain-containing protein [Pseudomonadales bacterium]
MSCSKTDDPASSSTLTKAPLKVLTWSGYETYLPRNGSPLDIELEYVQMFADAAGYELEEVVIEDFDALIPALLAGKGDLIAANMTITEARKALVNFTVPFEETVEFLAQSAAAKPINYGSQLDGKRLGVLAGTAYEETAKGLQQAYPGLEIISIAATTSHETIYDQLVKGDFDAVIEDKNTLNASLQYRDDIQRTLQASGKRKLAWAVAPERETLLKQLNQFLRRERLTIHDVKNYQHLWQRIQQEKTVRIAMRNNFASYYIWRGELLGFNYELAKKFAKDHKLRLEIIVAKSSDDLFQLVLNGDADIALDYLTPSKAREDLGIAFSEPYHYAQELIISRKPDSVIDSVDDLQGRSIALRMNSAYWQTAIALQQSEPGIRMLAVDETLETEAIIQAVANDQFDLTIADQHIAALEMMHRDDIQAQLSLGQAKGQSWAVKRDETELLQQVNAFIKKHYRGLFYNVKYNQYFKNQSRIAKHQQDYNTLQTSGELSPFDATVKKYAQQYDFDWRLLIAQMHQESKFISHAKSNAGATGLFQLMPRTAKQLGIQDLQDPESNIKAGVMYMDWVRERVKYMQPTDEEAIWFTLAAYNAGYGHVKDAIYLAEQKGYDPQRWFGHVEKAMLLLSQRKYASKARHGYVRGHEPVDYVRGIKRRYDSFVHNVTET